MLAAAVGLDGAAAAARRQEAIPLSAAPAVGAGGQPPAGWGWVRAEAGQQAGEVVGAAIDLVASRLVAHAGRRGIFVVAQGGFFGVLLELAECVPFTELWRASDARTLPVKSRHGVRQREWREVAAELREEPAVDFPIKDPRTVRWCCNFLVKNGGPSQHHEVWRGRRRFNGSEYGVDMHETLCKIADLMGTFDQLDMSNLACAEYLFRRLQVLEYYYDERDVDAGSANARLPMDEMRAFVGGGRPTSMVAPNLVDHVSKELERVSGIKKNARKLREEAAAAKRGAGKGDKPAPG